MTMVLGFGVWLHHMFATGLSNMALSFFSAVSLLIVIPSAVSFFAWIATIWTGRPVFNTAFLFVAGFIVVFVIGGVSGFMTGSVPVDWQLTDTYFVVAHIHYVLIGWNLFAVMAAIYYWFPKMTGRLLNERLGRWNFWVMFVGFNVGFFPMHISGLLGMPRRVYTYPEGMGWDTLNLITTIGSFVFAFGILLLLINVVISLRAVHRRSESVGCGHARMVGTVAAAALQFRRHSDGRESHSALGRSPADSAYRSSLRRECRSTARRRSWAPQGSMLSPRSS